MLKPNLLLIAAVLVSSAVFPPLVCADANRTEKINLKFIPAGELERALVGGPIPAINGNGGGLGTGGDRGALPAGIVAFTADPETSSITVTGSPKAIEEVRQIVRLLDVPKKRLQWTISALRPDDKLKAANAAGTDLDGNEAGELIREAEKRESLLYQTELPGANNLPVRLFSYNPAGDRINLSLLPRVNGDQTVTLILSGGDGKPSMIRRVSSDRSILFIPEGSAALLVRVHLLPDSPLK